MAGTAARRPFPLVMVSVMLHRSCKWVQMPFILFATAWGPRFGGINAFNQDFALGLARVLGKAERVFCVVLDPSPADIGAASKGGVTLVPVVGKPALSRRMDRDWVLGVGEWFSGQGIDLAGSYWVGHDVISGAIALKAAQIHGGVPAVIHHMDYAAYKALQTADPTWFDTVEREQAELFGEACAGAALFAVGPLLAESAARLSRREVSEVHELVPGFPEPDLKNRSGDDLTAITFGRLSPEEDLLKQGMLATIGFSRAVRDARNQPDSLLRRQNPGMWLIGLSGDESEATQVQDAASEEAGYRILVKPLPFDTDRKTLFERLEQANLAMMLSLQEGFGLTGWEAIAAEVPLIVSENSGLFRLIEKRLEGPGIGCVKKLRVDGPTTRRERYNEADVARVADAIREISGNILTAKRNAKRLKILLRSVCNDCTWDATALNFLTAIRSGHHRGHAPLPPRDDTRPPPAGGSLGASRWTPRDKHRRAPGLAEIDVHPPLAEGREGQFQLRCSVSLGPYAAEMPARGDEPVAKVTLTVTGQVEIVEKSKGAQPDPGSEAGRPGSHAPQGMRFAGGAWTIDVANCSEPANLLLNQTLCEVRRYATASTVELELRCLPSAIEVSGLPQGLPTPVEAVLRRLQQFVDVNTEDDRIVLAWSRMGFGST
jgi:hypothetical protein